ncbi:transporter substrate-binding domain-containing protein [Rhodoferax aquaticus]|uniref:Transporter substrate-binding domain-containing protein n=1 Tax=Rhodoferax aquaticus TaxID=2527691 RepID=A0A515ES22_9BURK|nr:transporter substrate-binding domain-containing protein [Rhodoferax aquaticus]QDL55477.1 transporter substrate-binding domain-containing protein [Rhodoferax aquaticus]
MLTGPLRSHVRAVCAMAATLWACSVGAADLILLPPPESALDKRSEYSEQLLKLVLKKTEAKYGKADIAYGPAMSRDRLLRELERGELVQVADAPTRPDFEDKLLVVRFPLRKGLLGYRLLLIDAKDKEKFANIESVEALKALRGGTGTQWAITRVMDQAGFLTAKDNDYESLFRRLGLGQFDYFARGVTEVFDELEARKHQLPNIVIESTLALYVPLPTYFFVSPTKPALASRISQGLEAIQKDGSFEKLFQEYHGEDIKRANLTGRRIFAMDNPLLSPLTPLDRKGLWLHFKH